MAPSRSITKCRAAVLGALVSGVVEGPPYELVVPLAVLGDPRRTGLCGSSNSDAALRKAQPRNPACPISAATSSPIARTSSRPSSASASASARATSVSCARCR